MNNLLNMLSGFMQTNSANQSNVTKTQNTYPMFMDNKNTSPQEQNPNLNMQKMLQLLLSGKSTNDILSMITGNNPIFSSLVNSQSINKNSTEKIESDKIDISSLTKIDT